MRKIIILFLIVPFLSCCNDSNFNNNNPYLPNYAVNLEINLSLPQFSDLKFVSNAVYVSGQGVSGIIVFNNSGNTYLAFDAACPNQAVSACSTMTIKGGTNVVCACDNAEYSLFSGQCIGTKCDGKQYPLKQYRVEVNGNNIRVYN